MAGSIYSFHAKVLHRISACVRVDEPATVTAAFDLAHENLQVQSPH